MERVQRCMALSFCTVAVPGGRSDGWLHRCSILKRRCSAPLAQQQNAEDESGSEEEDVRERRGEEACRGSIHMKDRRENCDQHARCELRREPSGETENNGEEYFSESLHRGYALPVRQK